MVQPRPMTAYRTGMKVLGLLDENGMAPDLRLDDAFAFTVIKRLHAAALLDRFIFFTEVATPSNALYNLVETIGEESCR